MRVSFWIFILVFALGGCRTPNRGSVAQSTPLPTATPTSTMTPTPTPSPTEDPVACHPGVSSNVVYVHPAGTNDGSLAADVPFSDIASAITYADDNYADAELHVAEGTYSVSSNITMATGISIIGGYKTDDWAVCDSGLYETIVDDTRTTGGTANHPNATFYLHSQGGHLILEGLTIYASDGDYTTAFEAEGTYDYTFQYNRVHNGACVFRCTGSFQYGDVLNTALVQYNTFYGGTVAPSYGIYQNTSSATLKNNTIFGGDTSSNYGIYSYQATSCEISSNVVTAGAGVYSYGIYSHNSGCNIFSNDVDGGTGSVASTGIYVLNSAAPNPNVYLNTVTGGSGASSYGIYLLTPGRTYQNKVDGGSGATAAYGIYVNGNNPSVYNNVVFGGTSVASTFGIFLMNPTDAVVRNNTVDGGIAGAGTGNQSTALYFNGADDPVIENNLFFTSEGHDRICVNMWMVVVGYNPLFRNNAFSDCPTYDLYTRFGDCATDHDGDNDSNTCDAEDVNSIFSSVGNFAATPVFVDAAGGDFSLAPSTPSSILTGGLDGVVESFDFTQDILGATRTGSSGTGWSVGAYEAD